MNEKTNTLCEKLKKIRIDISKIDGIINDKYKYERNFQIMQKNTKILNLTDYNTFYDSLKNNNSFFELKKLINMCIFLIHSLNIKKVIIHINPDMLIHKNFSILLNLIKFSGILNKFEFYIVVKETDDVSNYQNTIDTLKTIYLDLNIRLAIKITNKSINNIDEITKILLNNNKIEFIIYEQLCRKSFIKFLVTLKKNKIININNFLLYFYNDYDMLYLEDKNKYSYIDSNMTITKDLSIVFQNQ